MASCAEYVVTHPYTPQHDGEIALAFGDKLCDVKDLGNGWTLGKNLTSNCVGIFPRNHVGVLLDRNAPTELTSSRVTNDQPESESPNYSDYNQTEVKTPILCNTDTSLSSAGASQLDSVSHTPKKPPAAPIKVSSSRDSLSSAAAPSSRQPTRRTERGRSPATAIRQSPVAPRRSNENRHSLHIRPQDFPSQPSNVRISPTASSPNLLLSDDPSDYNRVVPAPSTTNPARSTLPQQAQPPSAAYLQEQYQHPSQQLPPSADKPQVAVRPNANRVLFSPSSREILNSQDFDDLPASASEVNVSDHPQSSSATYTNTRPAQNPQATPLTQRIRVAAPRGYIALSESQHRLPLYVDIDATSVDMQNTSNIYRESPENDAVRCRKPDEYKDYRSSKYTFSEDGSTSYASTARSRASLTRQHRNTARDRNDGFKTVLSLVVSLILGGLLFLWLYYELLYILPAAAAIAILAAIIMCCAFALSLHCRCIAALLMPNLFTKIGRIAYLCILSGLLISGPIMNIYGNIREASASMSCSAELTYNQTKQIYSLMYQPYSAILSGLNDTVSKLQVAAGNVTQELHPLKDGLGKAQTGVDKGYNALYDTHQTCQRTMKQAYSECSQGIQSAHGRCMDVMDALGNVYNHAISVLDRLNPDNWNNPDSSGRRTKRQARGNVLFRDRNGNSVTPKPPSKDVCHPLDYSSVCVNLNNTKEVTCEPSGWAGAAIQRAINTTQLALVNFKELFGFGLNLDDYLEQQAERSRQDHDITRKVEQEFSSRLEHFALVADILKKILSFGLLLLVFQSYRYLKNYLAKDNYDNWYITRRFKMVDKKRLEMHGESLLPLKKQEVNSLVDVTVCGLSPMENDLYRKGLILIIVHFLLGMLCILFDTLLYWLMDMIREHGSVEPQYSTSPGVQIVVNGNSAVAEFIQLFLDGFHARALLRMTDRKQCLPVPHQLSSIILLVLGTMYFIAFLLVILQAYGLRLRHKIIAYYYPQRERARTVHLYNMLVYRRSVMYRYLRRKIKARYKEQQVLKHISCLHCVAGKIPCFRIFTKWHGKLNCWGCNAPEDDTFHNCLTEQCPGLYCEECYDIIEHLCPLCQDNPESCDDFEDLDASELKPYSISNRVYV